MSYKCAMCQGEFEKGWTDEEAQAEMKQTFGASMSARNCDLVCDDCYQKINPANHPHLVEEAVKHYKEKP